MIITKTILYIYKVFRNHHHHDHHHNDKFLQVPQKKKKKKNQNTTWFITNIPNLYSSLQVTYCNYMPDKNLAYILFKLVFPTRKR